MLSWDDVRIFLAVRRQGSHAAAARTLHVDPTTIGRRIAALEKTLGSSLFRRTRQGLLPTDEGARLAVRAEHVEAEMLAAERELGSSARAASGIVRITAGDGILNDVLAPALGDLFAKHPALRVELRAEFRTLDFSRSEADVAVRLSRPREASLVTRRLGVARLGLYASEAYLARHGRPTTEEALAEHELIAYEPSLDRTAFMAWLLARSKRPIRIRCNTTASMIAACVAGQGIVITIEPAMRGRPGVVEVLPRAPIPTREVWGVVHQDMQRTPRVRAVLDWAANAFAAAGLR